MYDAPVVDNARHDYVDENALSRRVAEWQAFLKPILAEQEAHPDFNIDKVGQEMLKMLKEDETFAEMAKNKAPYEVSRLFLATLQLANNGNLDLSVKNGQLSMHLVHNTSHAHNVAKYRAPSQV